MKANPTVDDFQVKYRPSSSLSATDGNTRTRASCPQGRKPPVSPSTRVLRLTKPSFSIARLPAFSWLW